MPLARLERLLLLEQGSRELLGLAPLLRRRFGREPSVGSPPPRRTAGRPLGRLGSIRALRPAGSASGRGP
jgi:hypothetical protein